MCLTDASKTGDKTNHFVSSELCAAPTFCKDIQLVAHVKAVLPYQNFSLVKAMHHYE